MSLKALVKSLDEVAENLRSEYQEIKDGEFKGQFILNVSAVDGYSLAQVEKLQKALEGERKDNKHQKHLLEAFDGVTPEKAKEMAAKVAEMDGWDPDKKLAEHKTKFEKDIAAKFETEKAALVKKYSAELESMKTASSTAEAELQKILVQDALTNAIVEAGGKPKLLQPILRDRLKLVRGEDGARNVYVVDEKGEVRNSAAKNYLEPMSVGELVAEVKSDDDFAAMFQAKAASGAQGIVTIPAGGGNGNGSPRFSASEAFKAAHAAGK